MHSYSLAHLSDAVLLRDLAALVARDRLTTAELLAHIAEVDARRLYVPAGYSSMHAYCVEELRLSEDAASKRIQAARAARRFPVLFTALAEGRLHLSAVWLLAPHLTPENADELIEAATHRLKSEIEGFLARRFPPPEAPALVRAVTATAPLQHALGHVGNGASAPSGLLQHALGHVGSEASAPGGVDQHALGHAEDPRVNETQPSAERFLLRLTIGKSTHDKLRYAQALLSHAVPSGDIAQVLDRALDALIKQLEKRRFGAGTRARTTVNGQGSRPRRRSVRPRYVPAHVRRAVWERDQGQCTFMSASGHRCNARRFLEFDHSDPVARGGRATVDGMRLRCRAHNQHEAERIFGVDFMARKRRESRLPAAVTRVSAAQAGVSATQAQVSATQARVSAAQGKVRAAQTVVPTADTEAIQDVIAGLRSLGFRADEARRAAEFTLDGESLTIEDRMRAALMFLGRRTILASSRRSAVG